MLVEILRKIYIIFSYWLQGVEYAGGMKTLFDVEPDELKRAKSELLKENQDRHITNDTNKSYFKLAFKKDQAFLIATHYPIPSSLTKLMKNTPTRHLPSKKLPYKSKTFRKTFGINCPYGYNFTKHVITFESDPNLHKIKRDFLMKSGLLGDLYNFNVNISYEIFGIWENYMGMDQKVRSKTNLEQAIRQTVNILWFNDKNAIQMDNNCPMLDSEHSSSTTKNFYQTAIKILKNPKIDTPFINIIRNSVEFKTDLAKVSVMFELLRAISNLTDVAEHLAIFRLKNFVRSDSNDDSKPESKVSKILKTNPPERFLSRAIETKTILQLNENGRKLTIYPNTTILVSVEHENRLSEKSGDVTFGLGVKNCPAEMVVRRFLKLLVEFLEREFL